LAHAAASSSIAAAEDGCHLVRFLLRLLLLLLVEVGFGGSLGGLWARVRWSWWFVCCVGGDLALSE
jgi:hypothetical protein